MSTSVRPSLVLAGLATVSVAGAAAASGPDFQLRSGWPIQNLINSSVDGSVMVNLDADPELEEIRVVGNTVYGFELDGTIASGWPRVMSELGTFSPPAVGDIDGDGDNEIVINSFFYGIGGRTYAYELNGQLVPGWPIELGGNLKAPALGDVNGDGVDDVLVVVNVGGVGELHVLNGSAQGLIGFPRSLETTSGSGPTIGDVDGDGTNEIFAPSYDKLYGFAADGSPLPGFPWDPGATWNFNYTTAVLADFDDDGDREIVIGASNPETQQSRMYILDHDGTVRPGWPRLFDWGLYVPASVADVDGDGSLDVVAGSQALSPVPVCEVFAWRSNGQNLPGFPFSGTNAITAQIMIADVDGDGFVELLYDDNCAQCDLQGLNHDGTPLAGFPLVVDGSSFQQSPTLGDFDGDGLLDMAASGNFIQNGTTSVYQFTTNVTWDPAMAPVRTHQYDEKRSGVVPQEFGDDCPADLNDTGAIDFDDLLSLIAGWGTASGDVDGDGDTDFVDLTTLLAAWGPCP